MNLASYRRKLLSLPPSLYLLPFLLSPGVHTLAAILYQRYQEAVKVERHLRAVLSLLPGALKEGIPDELLYGRAGYLSCLLLLRKHLPDNLCQQADMDKAMRKVFDVILHSGRGRYQSGPPDKADKNQ